MLSKSLAFSSAQGTDVHTDRSSKKTAKATRESHLGHVRVLITHQHWPYTYISTKEYVSTTRFKLFQLPSYPNDQEPWNTYTTNLADV